LIDVDGTGPNPDEAGLDALKALRAWYPELKVLALASSPPPERVEDVHRAHAHGLLDKNEATPALLGQALDTLAEGGRFFPVAALGPPTAAVMSLGQNLRSALLTDRETEVLRYIAAGADNLRIAEQLKVSERTVRAHVSSLYRKLAAKNRVALALHSARMGLKAAEL